MPILRNPGPWTFAMFAAAVVLVGLMHFFKAPDAAKLGAELFGLFVATFGAKSALAQRPSSGGDANDETPAGTPEARAAMPTWPEVQITEAPKTQRTPLRTGERGGISTWAMVAICTFAVVAFLFVVLGLQGCAGAKVPTVTARDTVRGVVLVMIAGTEAADKECARIFEATGDRKFAESCDKAYVTIRQSLIVAASGVDLWDKAETQRVTVCSVVQLARSLAELARTIAGKGGREIPVIDDALSLASVLRCDVAEAGAP